MWFKGRKQCMQEKILSCRLSARLNEAPVPWEDTANDTAFTDVQRGSQFYGTFDFTAKPFDWGKGYSRPAVSAGEYVVYEVPLRTFTASPTSGLPAERRGTFLGFLDKVSIKWQPAASTHCSMSKWIKAWFAIPKRRRHLMV